MAMWANGCGTIMTNTLRQRKPIRLARTAVHCGYTGAAAGMILLKICAAHIVPHLRRIRAALSDDVRQWLEINEIKHE